MCVCVCVCGNKREQTIFKWLFIFDPQNISMRRLTCGWNEFRKAMNFP